MVRGDSSVRESGVRHAFIALVVLGLVGLVVALGGESAFGLHLTDIAMPLAGISGIALAVGVLGLLGQGITQAQARGASQQTPNKQAQPSATASTTPTASTPTPRRRAFDRDVRLLFFDVPIIYFFFLVVPLVGLVGAGLGAWFEARGEAAMTDVFVETLQLNPLTATPTPVTISTTGYERIALYTRAADPNSSAVVVVYGKDADGDVRALKHIDSTHPLWTRWEGKTPAGNVLSVQAEEPPHGGATSSTKVDVIVALIP